MRLARAGWRQHLSGAGRDTPRPPAPGRLFRRARNSTRSRQDREPRDRRSTARDRASRLALANVALPGRIADASRAQRRWAAQMGVQLLAAPVVIGCGGSSRGGPAGADTNARSRWGGRWSRRHRTRCLTPDRRHGVAADVVDESLRPRNTCTYSRVPGLPSRASRRRSRRNSSGSAHGRAGSSAPVLRYKAK